MKQPAIPPPHAAEAERYVLGALLDGAPLAALGSLRARDFFDPYHAAVLVAVDMVHGARLPVTPLRVAMALQVLGAGPVESHARRLSDLRWQPVRIPIRPEVERVLEAARARRLIAWAQTFGAKLRTGEWTSADARRALARIGARAASMDKSRSTIRPEMRRGAA